MSSSQSNKAPLLCRLGFHKRTTIPRDIWAAAHAAGLRSGPLWYVGRQSPAWCRRGCGWDEAPPRRKTMEDLVAEVREELRDDA